MAKSAEKQQTSLQRHESSVLAPRRLFFDSPFRELDRMRREMDQVWEDFFSETPMWGRESGAFGGWFPDFDLSETKNELILKAELPGIDPKEVDISLQENMLLIKGEKKQQFEEKDENYHFAGRSYGTFARAIELPVGVKADQVHATYKDGILKLVMPKSEESKGKGIKIKVEA